MKEKWHGKLEMAFDIILRHYFKKDVKLLVKLKHDLATFCL